MTICSISAFVKGFVDMGDLLEVGDREDGNISWSFMIDKFP